RWGRQGGPRRLPAGAAAGAGPDPCDRQGQRVGDRTSRWGARPPTVGWSGDHAETTKRPCSTQERIRVTMKTTMTTNDDHATNGRAPGVYSGNDPLAQFHATTRVLLETQQAHCRVLERLLETQERVLLYGTQGAPPAAAVMPPSPPMQPAPAPPTPA